MKNFNVKSLICGLSIGIIGTIGITNVFALGEIKSATCEKTKVFFNNSSIPLKNSLISIVKNGENDAKIYMPAVEVLECLGYDVSCNTSEGSINISSKTEKKAINSNYDNNTITSSSKDSDNNNIQKNQADKLGLEVIQKTGNWSYVEPLFSYMTPTGIKDVVNLYIQEKGGTHKNVESAFPYINNNNFTTDSSNQLKTQSDYDTLATKALSKTNDIFSILFYLPYMSPDKIDTMVKDYIDKTNNFNCIYNVHNYMSTKAIDDTVKNYINKTGDYGTVAAILQFMSDDASNYIANKYINESKDKQYRQLFTPYLKR